MLYCLLQLKLVMIHKLCNVGICLLVEMSRKKGMMAQLTLKE